MSDPYKNIHPENKDSKERLSSLHELAKDIRIAQLESQLKVVTEFAQLMAEMTKEDD